MNAKVFDITAKQTKGEVELADTVFGAQINDALLAQYVFVYLANQRETISHTKTRGEVSGGGRKPWRQKGTGRARVGSTRSPIWRKGGVVFGPRKERNWKKEISKSMKLGALRSAFSAKQAKGDLMVVDNFVPAETKLTQQARSLMDAFAARKLTFVVGVHDPRTVKAFNNVPGARVILVSDLNAYDVLNSGKLLLDKAATEFINEKWA